PRVGRPFTYVTLCLDLILAVVLIVRVGDGGLRTPFLGTQLVFTTLFAILFPKPLAILPPLLALPVTTRLDLLMDRTVTAVELSEYVKTFKERTGLKILFEKEGLSQKLTPDTQLVIFRVLQEGLSNAAKHAHATRVEVKLSYERDKVILSIKDDGRGFDAAAT